jgi:hypothetical protein
MLRGDILERVKYFAWDDAKNAKLRRDCGIGFEDIVFHIGRGDPLDILEHPNLVWRRTTRFSYEKYLLVLNHDWCRVVIGVTVRTCSGLWMTRFGIELYAMWSTGPASAWKISQHEGWLGSRQGAFSVS